jgi:hypothetical protein
MIRGCRDWPFMAAEILGVDLSLPQDVLHFAALHHPHCRQDEEAADELLDLLIDHQLVAGDKRH